MVTLFICCVAIDRESRLYISSDCLINALKNLPLRNTGRLHAHNPNPKFLNPKPQNPDPGAHICVIIGQQLQPQRTLPRAHCLGCGAGGGPCLQVFAMLGGTELLELLFVAVLSLGVLLAGSERQRLWPLQSAYISRGLMLANRAECAGAVQRNSTAQYSAVQRRSGISKALHKSGPRRTFGHCSPLTDSL
jgi:hypothetical protein